MFMFGNISETYTHIDVSIDQLGRGDDHDMESNHRIIEDQKIIYELISCIESMKTLGEINKEFSDERSVIRITFYRGRCMSETIELYDGYIQFPTGGLHILEETIHIHEIINILLPIFGWNISKDNTEIEVTPYGYINTQNTTSSINDLNIVFQIKMLLLQIPTDGSEYIRLGENTPYIIITFLGINPLSIKIIQGMIETPSGGFHTHPELIVKQTMIKKQVEHSFLL